MTGLVESLVDTVNLDYVDAANELKSGQIDAFFCTAGIQTSVIEELSKECDVKLIGIDDKCRDRLKSVYGFYTDYTIPAGTYEGQTQDVVTLGVRAVRIRAFYFCTCDRKFREVFAELLFHGIHKNMD